MNTVSAKSKKSGWPKAQVVHSPENKTGQSWKANEGKACVLIWHYSEDKPPYFTSGDEVTVNQGPKQCSLCGSVIRYDERGYAACEACGELYNSGISANVVSKRMKKKNLGSFINEVRGKA